MRLLVCNSLFIFTFLILFNKDNSFFYLYQTIFKKIVFFFADWTGLEPATPCVTGRYSNQLNYRSFVIFCSPTENRTPLPRIFQILNLQIFSYHNTKHYTCALPIPPADYIIYFLNNLNKDK